MGKNRRGLGVIMSFGIGGTYLASINQIATNITWVQIDKKTAAGGEHSIAFTSIPTGYKWLRIQANFSNDAGSGYHICANNDTANNYRSQYIQAAAAVVSAAEALNIGYFFADGSNWSEGGVLDFYVQNVATLGKFAWGFGNHKSCLVSFDGYWNNTSDEISRLELFLDGGGHFVAGNNLTLYGQKQ